jgi:hypothetical protein
VVSEVVAMSIGSSWPTAGTIGGAWAATMAAHLPFALSTYERLTSLEGTSGRSA